MTNDRYKPWTYDDCVEAAIVSLNTPLDPNRPVDLNYTWVPWRLYKWYASEMAATRKACVLAYRDAHKREWGDPEQCDADAVQELEAFGIKPPTDVKKLGRRWLGHLEVRRRIDAAKTDEEAEEIRKLWNPATMKWQPADEPEPRAPGTYSETVFASGKLEIDGDRCAMTAGKLELTRGDDQRYDELLDADRNLIRRVPHGEPLKTPSEYGNYWLRPNVSPGNLTPGLAQDEMLNAPPSLKDIADEVLGTADGLRACAGTGDDE